MHEVQAMFEAMMRQQERKRAETQLTLGKLIDRLKGMSPDAEIDCIYDPHSYRGYYSDLAFMKGEGRITAQELLAVCQGAMGEVFEGYKGGEYQMGRNTPLWLAEYGSCGQKIISLHDDGAFEFADNE